jgi:hypothetical protein
MNNETYQIFALFFIGVPTLLLGFFIGVAIEYFSWSDTKNRKLNTDFKYRYKKPISAKEFAVENYISLKQSKQFLDNKLLEFGGIVVSQNSDSEYHFDISGFLNGDDEIEL